MKITFEDVRNNPIVKTYIQKADESLIARGYTEHSFAHVTRVAEDASRILLALGYDEREAQLAKIAGYLHDIGNVINRVDHAQSGALMAFKILSDMNMDPKEIAMIIAAIGNHDEKTGTAVSPVSAAVIIADKTDVRRNRVRNRHQNSFDIHDRVNYAAVASKLTVNAEDKTIQLDIELDDEICSVMDYFEIFLERMLMCRRAAELLGCSFKMRANGNKIL